MTDRTVTRNEDLTMPERAALDVWTSGSPDTTGMLCAVRAALRAHDSTEDARVAISEKALRDVNDTIIGAVENGPWVLIADPALRKVVGEYVADACHSVALDADLDEAMECAHNALPTRLDTVSRLVAPDARERLARHLCLQSVGPQWAPAMGEAWDRGEVDRSRWQAEADTVLAVITGREGLSG